MATTIITGRDIVLTIDGDSYDAQGSTATLTAEIQRETYNTFDGKHYKTIDKTATLAVEMFADWGASGSLCQALWTAAESAPDTSLPFSMTAASGAVFTGTLFPTFPVAGGTAPDAQTVSITFLVESFPLLND